jgi:hypothetical protein
MFQASDVVNPLLLIPRSTNFSVSVPVSAVTIKSADAVVALLVFLRLSCVYVFEFPVRSPTAPANPGVLAVAPDPTTEKQH